MTELFNKRLQSDQQTEHQQNAFSFQHTLGAVVSYHAGLPFLYMSSCRENRTATLPSLWLICSHVAHCYLQIFQFKNCVIDFCGGSKRRRRHSVILAALHTHACSHASIHCAIPFPTVPGPKECAVLSAHTSQTIQT